MLAAGLLARKGGRARPESPAAREDQPRPRQPRGDRLSSTRPVWTAAGATGLPHRRLWLHDLHRQQRSAAAGRGRRRSTEGNLVAAAVLSGNRNFEGRVQPAGEGQLPGQPAAGGGLRLGRHGGHRPEHRAAGHRQRRPAGLLEGHLAQPGGNRRGGRRRPIRPEMFRQRYANVFEGQRDVEPICGRRRAKSIPWDPDSTYIQEPPFLAGLAAEPGPIRPILGARVLAALGDSVTTDHISPAGSIAASSPAGQVPARVTASRRPISTATDRGGETTG